MKNLTLEHIARAVGGTLTGFVKEPQREITAVTTDSRKVEPGALFIPIVGARADGHDFIPQVMAQGAACTLSEKDLGEQDFPYIRVDSSLQAVKDLAEYYLEQLDLPVVGITGSVGKTSTKEMIAAVLAQKFRVLKTQGNFNNELGLPLTIFRLREEDEIAVLEMGISDFGEMSRLAKVARPDYSVITNIGCCHLENLKDRDGILKAKTEIFDFMKPGGRAILNGDDDKLRTVRRVQGKSPLFFGMDQKNEIWADEVESLGLKGTRCRIHMGAESFSVQIPVPGRHMVSNALAGAAVGLSFGMTAQEIQAGIESLQPVSGRFHIMETEKFTIIDDCYNANPVSMKASLDVLKDALGRRTAILGDMAELGADERKLHAQVGQHAARAGIDALICVGELGGEIARAAREEDPSLSVVHLADLDALLDHLPELVKAGDTILVKASHCMNFERIVEALAELAGK